MAFNPPSIEEIIDREKTYIKEVLKSLNPTDQNAFLYSLLVAMANLSNDNNMQLKIDIIPNSFVTTCKTEDALQPFADIKSVPKNLATVSSGKAVISGITGTVIPIGTNFLANDVKYRQTATVEIAEQSIGISNISANGRTVTVTTVSEHNFASNIPITISGCNTEAFNGTFNTVTVTGLTTFTYTIENSVTATESSGDLIASATIAVLNLRSQTYGQITNLKNGDSLAIEGQIAGMNNNAYTMFSGISGGADDEAFEEWKKRVVYRFQHPITYFNVANIKTAVLAISGNTRCWVKECTPNVGQVTVYFVRDNDADILPDSNEIAKAKEAVEALRTVKDSKSDVFVYAPTSKVVDFNISNVVPNTATMKTAIENNIKQFFDDNVDLEATLSLEKIKSAIQSSFDLETGKQLDTYTLNNPSADIVCGTGELPVLGTITFS